MPEILAILSIILLGGYVTVLIRYRLILQKKRPFEAPAPSEYCFISVIVPARNEEVNIRCCLESLIAQEYPHARFEIIVIDDHSEDGTADIVSAYPAENLRLIPLKDHVSGAQNSYKKKAIETGVGMAKGELIVTTDADCTVPDKWLSTINSYYQKEKCSAIVMPVSITAERKATDIFESLDFMSMQGITMGSVEKDSFSLCNGANLAYVAKAFREVRGFEGIDGVASGDDMLLLEKMRMKGMKAGYLFSSNVIVTTPPSGNMRAFLNQRIRWASKTTAYKDKRILMLWGWIYLLNLTLLISGLFCLFSCTGITFFGVQLSLCYLLGFATLFKTIAEMIFLWPVARFYGKTGLLVYFPVAEPFHIVYVVITGFLGLTGNYEWKGRRVH